MNITLDQARAFCALIEHGSYQAAAEHLHKSHSSIVYALQCLEDQTGLKLLDRGQYRTRPTDSGTKVHLQCLELLESAARLEQVCHDLGAGWEPSVTLVYDGILPSDPFLRIFKTFKEKKIPTTLDIYADYLTGVEKSFQELDAEFMISILTPRTPGLHSIALEPIKNFLVAHRDSPLCHRSKPWTIQELKDFNFFTVRDAHKSLNLRTKELEELSTFHLSDFYSKKRAILQGGGFGWLPEHMITAELKKKNLRLVSCEFPSIQEFHPRLFHRKKKSLGRAAQMIQQLLEN